MDYYKELEINKDASQIEIAQQYRRLALIYHPQLSKLNMNQAYKKFCSISEAYQVLSDINKKNVYDNYGYEVLKHGKTVDGQLIGYAFQGNPELIFENFFGSSNPYTQIYDKESKEEFGSLLSYAFQSNNYKIEKPLELTINVQCELEELYNGCTKNISYKRIVLGPDNITLTEVQEIKKIEIFPGYKNDQQIRFSRQGHEASGQITSDLVFIIKEIPHQKFKRDNDNLIYTQQVTLLQALLSNPISIKCLDNRDILFSIDSVINPKTQKYIKNEGMPIYDDKRIDLSCQKAVYVKGDLIIKFDIIFPNSLDEETKNGLNDILI